MCRLAQLFWGLVEIRAFHARDARIGSAPQGARLKTSTPLVAWSLRQLHAMLRLGETACVVISDDGRAALQRAVGSEGLVTGETLRRAYELDSHRGYCQTPGLVVLPRSTDEVREVFRICRDYRLRIVPRGSGTGLSGAAVPIPDGVLVVTSRMRKILEVDPIDRRAVVEAGVANAEVSRAAAPYGLRFAPDPSSRAVCSVGGNLAHNSSGASYFKYGAVVDHVVAAQVVLADGACVSVGDITGNLPAYDLLSVLAGAEGTLGLVTELVVRLSMVPESTRTLVAHFRNVQTAIEAGLALVEAGIEPSALELLDSLATEAIGLDGESPILVLSLEGPAAEVEPAIEEAQSRLRRKGAKTLPEILEGAEHSVFWEKRNEAFVSVRRLSESYVILDGVVPPTRLAEALRRFQKRTKDARLRAAIFARVAEGHLMPVVLFDGQHAEQARRARKLSSWFIELCVDCGGSLAGGHGVGEDKACDLPRMFGQDDIEVMRRLRRAFDPEERMNPGKVLPTPERCGAMSFRPHPLEKNRFWGRR